MNQSGGGLDTAALVECTRMLVDAAAAQELTLRAFGGVGILMHCPMMAENGFRSTRKDIDFVARAGDSGRVHEFLVASGLSSCGPENEYRGGVHRTYSFNRRGASLLEVDVYSGALRFNFWIPSPYFDESSPYTVPVTALALSKLAIVEITQRDIVDLCALFAEHDIGLSNDPEVVQADVFARACGVGWWSWGFSETCKKNLSLLRAAVVSGLGCTTDVSRVISERIQKLQALVVECRKSMCWTVRKVIGRRLRWFDVVQPPSATNPGQGKVGSL